MPTQRTLRNKIIQVLGEALKAKDLPENIAPKIIADAKKISVKKQLERLKFRKTDIDYVFRQIFEKINIASSARYYSMNDLDKIFHLKGSRK